MREQDGAAIQDRAAVVAPAERTPTPWLRHLCHFGPLAGFCAASLVLAWPAVPLRDLPLRGLPQVATALVVAANVLPLGMASWSAVLGALASLWRACGGRAVGPVTRPPTGRARTAIVLPVYEEDATRVFAAAAVMADLVAGEPAGLVEVFVLSDTRSEAGIAAERRAAARLAAERVRHGGGGAEAAVHYRRRADNAGRKAGNIAAFCAEWGGAYDFMVVLDADSTMSGAAIARLIGAMEANPRAGLIQCMCYPAGRDTLFARLQQFNAWLYGPLFQRGVAFWQGPRGNYWGHNAILRLDAFAGACGLPSLPGPPPFGGEILSHDTVEAALLLRAGWDVWMLPDGRNARGDVTRTVDSWEETPTNLLDHLGRDRRWCQGNLQHALVLGTRGLRAASWYHLIRGLLHYLSSILALAWLVLTVAVDRHPAPGADRALATLVAALIAVPRLLGVVAALVDGAVARGFGGRARLLASAVLEQLVGALVYPVTLVFHAIFVAGALRGHVVRWDAQTRGDRGLAWREAARLLAVPLAVALALLAPVAARAPVLAALLAPGLLLGVPLAVWTSRPSAWMRRLFVTPEEADPHPARRAVTAVEHALDAAMRERPPAPLPARRGLAMPAQVLRARRTRPAA